MADENLLLKWGTLKGWRFESDEMPGGACTLEANQWRRACDYCAGRGFQLDWIDPGGVMQAVPGDTCRECGGAGLLNSLEPQEKQQSESA